MAEVVEPTLQRAIQTLDGDSQRLARFARCQLADPFHELSVALRSRKAKVAAKRVAQKREALFPRVHDVRLVRVQRQPVAFHPAAYFRQGRLGLFAGPTQDDEIIRVAYHLEAKCRHMMVQRVEIGVGQNRGKNRPLGYSGFRSPGPQLFQNPLAKELLDQPQDAAIRYLLLDNFHQPIFRDRIKVTFQIRVHHVHIPGGEQLFDASQGIVASTAMAEAEAPFMKRGVQNRLDHVDQGRLHDPVSYRRHGQR